MLHPRLSQPPHLTAKHQLPYHPPHHPKKQKTTPANTKIRRGYLKLLEQDTRPEPRYGNKTGKHINNPHPTHKPKRTPSNPNHPLETQACAQSTFTPVPQLPHPRRSAETMHPERLNRQKQETRRTAFSPNHPHSRKWNLGCDVCENRSPNSVRTNPPNHTPLLRPHVTFVIYTHVIISMPPRTQPPTTKHFSANSNHRHRPLTQHPKEPTKYMTHACCNSQTHHNNLRPHT